MLRDVVTLALGTIKDWTRWVTTSSYVEQCVVQVLLARGRQWCIIACREMITWHFTHSKVPSLGLVRTCW